MKGFLYRLRMARAARVWDAARRAERRIRVESGPTAESFRRMAIRLTKKAHRVEGRARNGRLPG